MLQIVITTILVGTFFILFFKPCYTLKNKMVEEKKVETKGSKLMENVQETVTHIKKQVKGGIRELKKNSLIAVGPFVSPSYGDIGDFEPY